MDRGEGRIEGKGRKKKKKRERKNTVRYNMMRESEAKTVLFFANGSYLLFSRVS